MEAIYERPRDYDLEHEGDDEDVGLYAALVKTLRPRRVLELASGSGRVTIPLARLAPALDFDTSGSRSRTRCWRRRSGNALSSILRP